MLKMNSYSIGVCTEYLLATPAPTPICAQIAKFSDEPEINCFGNINMPESTFIYYIFF